MLASWRAWRRDHFLLMSGVGVRGLRVDALVSSLRRRDHALMLGRGVCCSPLSAPDGFCRVIGRQGCVLGGLGLVVRALGNVRQRFELAGRFSPGRTGF
jgi:hypothetical protein